MDYSKESDYETNTMCAKVLGKDPNYYSPVWEEELAFKLQAENKIGLSWDRYAGLWVAFSNYKLEECEWGFEKEPQFYETNENPLRAICIVFLMMQET